MTLVKGDWVRVVNGLSSHYKKSGCIREIYFSDIALVDIEGVICVFHIDSLVPFSGHGPDNSHYSQELPP